jgi:diguanylate cyclase (GGDEF)-like protein
VRIAEIVRGAVRAVDHAARLGGDEFGVLLAATGDAEAVAVAERIRDLVGALLPVDGVRLSASLGVADAPVGMTAEAVLRRAGAALHAAKRAGKNRVERAA